MEFLVIDLETVPKTETAHTWTPKKDKDGKDEFPPLHVHKICCIGYCTLGDPDSKKTLSAGEPITKYSALFDYSEKDGPQDEKDILTMFMSIFNEMNQDGKFAVVTWNGRTFDLPVLIHRLFSYGMDTEWYYGDKEMNNRYGKRHIDVMEAFCNFGTFGGYGRTSMDSVAKLSGLPGKMDVTGDSVAQMHKDGRYEDIQEYCLTDVIQTALVFLRFCALSGKMNKDYARAVSNNLFDIVKQDKRNQIQQLYLKTDQTKFFSF